MSLKAVHLVFVAALTAMALGTGAWKLNDYFATAQRNAADLLFAGGAFVAAGAVLFYGRYFLKKMKSIGYI